MEILLAVAAVVWGVRHAYQHVTGQLRESRDERMKEAEARFPQGMSKPQRAAHMARHDSGWAAREILGGFPVARTGWHSGWLAHKTATLQQKQIRHHQRQAHGEARQAWQQTRAQRKASRKAQRAANAARIDTELRELPSLPKRTPRQKAQQAWDNVVSLDSRRSGGSQAPGQERHSPADSPTPVPAPAPQDPGSTEADARVLGMAHRNAHVAPFGDVQQGGDAEAKLMTALGEHGETTAENHPHRTRLVNAYLDGLGDDPPQVPPTRPYALPPQPEPNGNGHHDNHEPDTQGEQPVPTQAPQQQQQNRGQTPDTTYDQLQQQSVKDIDEAEQRLAQLKAQRWMHLAEGLAGALRDGDTMSSIQDMVDADEEEIKRLEERIDMTQQFKDQLERNHGGLNEAHKDAPVPGAQPEFYDN